MSRSEEKPDGTIRVYFSDNTYRTLPLKIETPVSDVVEWLCKKSSTGSRILDPARHELFIVFPTTRTQTSRERCLLRTERPLEMQAQGATQAFKYLIREVSEAAAAVDALSPGLNPTQVMGEEHLKADLEAQRSGLSVGSCSGIVGGSSEPSPLAMASGAVRTGAMERPQETSSGTIWHPCTIILTEDRIWFSDVLASLDSRLGGGMDSLALRDCERVVEHEDKRQLRLVARGETHTFRARNASERTSWLVAIAKQAALVKERGILDEAEQVIASIEEERALVQLRRLEAFETLASIISVRESREQLLQFAREEFDASPPWWPADIGINAVLACVDRRRSSLTAVSPREDIAFSQHDDPKASDELVWSFLEETLFPRFLVEPAHQSLLCRLAASLF